MKTEEIKVGGVYKVRGRKELVKVTNKTADGWCCQVMGTKKAIKAGSAGFFLKEVEPVKKPAKAKKAKATKPEGEPGKLSLLGAAVQVLAAAKPASMNVGAIYAAIVEQGLWTPGDGKTPTQTLSSQLQAELRKPAPRIVRCEQRGHFAAA